jgi:hypothetical protein
VEECKLISTPFDINSRLSKIHGPVTIENENEIEIIPYGKTIGCLMYAIIAIRLDIIIAIRVVNNFAESPQLLH